VFKPFNFKRKEGRREGEGLLNMLYYLIQLLDCPILAPALIFQVVIC
jgi:hypothetical protein